MIRQNYRTIGSVRAWYLRPSRPPAPRPRRLNLEQLEQRDLPAPVTAAPVFLPAQSNGQAASLNASQAQFTSMNQTTPTGITGQSPFGTQAASVNAVQALTGVPGTAIFSAPPGTANSTAVFGVAGFAIPGSQGSLLPASFPFAGNQLAFLPTPQSSNFGFPTAPPGASVVNPFLTSSTAFPVPVGAPNPVRLGPAPPATLGPAASLPGTSPYIVEDMALSGGGGQQTDPRLLPRNDRNPDDPQTRTEASAADPQDRGSTPDSAALWEALLQVAAPGTAWTDAAAAPTRGEP